MDQTLLDYYEAELNYIRAAASEFAAANPEVASNLHIKHGEHRDPHVERLIESFAFLTARIRRKLSDQLPELTDALLSSLYPHFLAPVPSTLIVQFALDPSQAELAAGVDVEAGTALESEPVAGHRLRFRTGYSARALPIEIAHAGVQPLSTTFSSPAGVALSELRLTIKCFNPAQHADQLALNPLRICLAHDERMGLRIYELLLADTIEICVAANADDPTPRPIPLTCLRPVGFDSAQALLPVPPNSQPGYGLLSEYAAFPNRFLFVELAEIPTEALGKFVGGFDLVFYLRRPAELLERQINAKHFALGCSPAINLFEARAEPIRLTTDHRVRLTPNFRPADGYEVYALDKLVTRSARGIERRYVPFYEHWHLPIGESPAGYYQFSRETPLPAENDPQAPTQVFVSLIDSNLRPAPEPDTTLHADLQCFNGDLPTRFGGVRRLQLASGSGALSVRPLGAPTPTLRRNGINRWQLISHLTLNQMSISANNGVEYIRQILRLYAGPESSHIRAAADALAALSTRRTVARVADGPAALCRGVEIEALVDASRLAEGSAFLFGAVLENFCAVFCTVNSFTQFVLRTSGDKRLVKRWPPRAGRQWLI